MKVVVFAGGVGGARFADGLYRILEPDELTVIVNTGDDFEHLGLWISPDIDTVCYSLAGLENLETGWGRKYESWNTLEEIKRLGGPGWFQLGDRDLATHLERSRRLSEGQTLSQITKEFCRVWGVKCQVLPMSDERVSTMVQTEEFGEIGFQDYFVRYQFQPVITGFRFDGIELAQPAPGVLEAVDECDVIFIAPSNPFVSIDPILKLPGILNRLVEKRVIAVSPIIGGKAVKGPLAKMFTELGINVSALAVASHYRGILDGFVFDLVDAGQSAVLEGWGIISMVTDILMPGVEDRQRLAAEVVTFYQSMLNRGVI